MMEWIQQTSNETWDRENMAKKESDPARLKLDPVSHLPSRPYLKPEPIYAGIDSVDDAATVPKPSAAISTTAATITTAATTTATSTTVVDVGKHVDSGGRSHHHHHHHHHQFPVSSQNRSNSLTQTRDPRFTAAAISAPMRPGSGSGRGQVRHHQSYGRAESSQRPRVATVSGSGGGGAVTRTASASYSRRQFSLPTQVPGGQVRGIGVPLSRSATATTAATAVAPGASSSGQPQSSTSYPTARFEKDYYVLDV